MNNFIVSARKYRPTNFNTVVGQHAITTTLKNAIKNNQLAQAFLFCGPRGVGKTTCARILAKTINCEHVTDNIEPCNECPSCKSFDQTATFNIFELDAASNNSVDDIRNLVDQVRIPPQQGRYKVYIIDEVHMLSPAAFNAFLKTLEEPPAYAKFILATTEKHKIIPTILSRCQVFDFRRISVDDMAHHLAYVAKNEGVIADEDALHIIAQKADGSLRDALSIFDQLVSFTSNNISYENAIENLNVLDYDYYFKATQHLLQADISSLFLLFNEVLEKGFDGHHFVIGLSEHFRNLLVCQDASTIKLLEVSENIKNRYKEQAHACNADLLFKALDVLSKCDIEYKTSNNKRLHVEVALVQLANLVSERTNSYIPKASIPAEHITQKKTNLVTPAEEAVKTVTAPVKQTKPIAPKGNTISIKSHTKSEKDKAESQGNLQESIKESNEFSQEELEKSWQTYALSLAQSNPSFYSTLTKRKPLLKSNFVIELTIDNRVQEEELKLKKSDLLEALRKELKNQLIQLETPIVQNNSGTDKPYTPLEKFKKMAEKNPSLQKLKDSFDLEIDF